jgi:oxygen-independent coproporphyrinogen-3 oxidase
VDAVGLEIGRAMWEGPPFATLYLGGGTPSALTVEQLAEILDRVRRTFVWEEGVRVTLEANPEDVTADVARQWRELGITCVSLGVQSLDAEVLRFLGRRHTPERARQAVEACRAADLATVAFDLIYGYPGHTVADWQLQLRQAVALDPDHLSCYQLTIHRGTRFGGLRARGELTELADPVQAELFRVTHLQLSEAGFEGYEVSSFASAPEHRSRHNLTYWEHAPYLGLGPSAHSFDGHRQRWWNRRKVRLWQNALGSGRSPVEEQETLTCQQMALEAVMLGLRMPGGIDVARVRDRWGVDLEPANRELLERLVAGGWLIVDGSRWRPTLEGLAIANSLARAIEIPEPDHGASSSTSV